MNTPHGSVRRARRPGPRRFCAVLGAVLAGVACMGATQAQMQASEVQVKAAFIYNFALFTNWPADVMQADAPMVVCVTAQHPLQAAFREEHALQCGFCTPGMIMAAYGLLRANPHPSEAEIRAGLEGNLCRCTGYHNIVRAILAAAAEGAR